jgi:hypothetical protein
MKKMTQADIDAGLTQADVDAGMRGGRNERISDEDRARAMMNSARDGESIVDKYRDRKAMPDAQSFPVDMGSRAAPRTAPRPAQRPVAMPSPAPRADAMEMPEEGASSAPGTTRRAPSRGSYDQNGPIGDLIDLIRGSARRGRGNPNPSIYRGESESIPGAKRGGAVNKMAKKKSSVSSASKRGDGIASRGKTKGRML